MNTESASEVVVSPEVASPAPEVTAAPAEAPAETKPPKKIRKKKVAPEAAPAEAAPQADLLSPDAPAAEPVKEEPKIPPAVAQAEEAAKLPAFKFFDHVPFGGPGSEKKPAIPVECTQENAAQFLFAARDVILAVIGERDGVKSPLDPKQFHSGIRQYLPIEKFKHTHGGTGQPITSMDEGQYACRVAHRLLCAVKGKKIPLNGGLGSREAVKERANAVYEALVNLAAEKQITLVAE